MNYPDFSNKPNILNFNDLIFKFYVYLEVKDEPGVLATIASLFGDNNVSIESVIHEGRGDNAELVLVTHEAAEEDLTGSIDSIANLESVSSVTSTIRVYL